VRFNACVPFRVFGLAAGSAAFRPPVILLGLAARSALSSATVSRYWFSDPTLPLTVVSAVWFSRCRTLLIAVKQVNKRSALRVYLPREFCPANPSRLAAACQLLSWALRPYSTYQDRRSTDRGLCRPTVFRLQGLVTLVTAYALRSLAGFVSRRQRSWDLPFEAFSSQEVCERFRPNAPTYRFAAMIPGASVQPT